MADPNYRALGFDFSVSTPDPALRALLARLLEPFASPSATAQHVYGHDIDHGHDPAHHAVSYDGVELYRGKAPAMALAYVLWHLNRVVVDANPDCLVVHASAAELDGVAAVFPAPQNSGKTTLVAGLLRAGVRYLTDEAVVIDPATLLIRPFPKALSIGRGSWEVLADLEPDVDPAASAYLQGSWQLPPMAVRRDALAPPTAPSLIVFPSYTRGADTRLVALRRGEAAVLLAENCFNFTELGRRGLMVVRDVVQACDAYRLTIGDLDEACATVVELFRRRADALPGDRTPATERTGRRSGP